MNETINQMHYVLTEPDSHYFDDLGQILNSLKTNPSDLEFVIKGLENSIKSGYILKKQDEGSLRDQYNLLHSLEYKQYYTGSLDSIRQITAVPYKQITREMNRIQKQLINDSKTEVTTNNV